MGTELTPVFVYGTLTDPDRLDAPADWPGEGPLADRVRRQLDAASVRVRRIRNR